MNGSDSGRVVLFENSWLEKLTVITPRGFAVTWAVLLPLIAVAGWGLVSPLAGLALVLAGLALWSLFEYAAHRFFFHWKSGCAPVQRLVYTIHGNHHVAPDDPLRNLMPPVASIPIALTVWAILFAAIGAQSAWVFLGFMLGYVTYDMVHYACHQWPMRGRLGAKLKRHHMRHHHVNAEGNFAITAIFLDRWLGSRITSLKRRQKSPAVPSEPSPATD